MQKNKREESTVAAAGPDLEEAKNGPENFFFTMKTMVAAVVTAGVGAAIMLRHTTTVTRLSNM